MSNNTLTPVTDEEVLMKPVGPQKMPDLSQQTTGQLIDQLQLTAEVVKRMEKLANYYKEALKARAQNTAEFASEREVQWVSTDGRTKVKITERTRRSLDSAKLREAFGEEALAPYYKDTVYNELRISAT